MRTCSNFRTVAELGFWEVAQRHPENLALVAPDGTEMTAGELFASSNKLVHGLRALGVSQGDAVAAVLPNSTALVELYLALHASRFLPRSDQPPPSGPRDRVHPCRTPKRRLLFCGEEFGDICRACRRRSQSSGGGALRGREARRLPLLRRDKGRAVRTDLPEDRATGAVMNYTAGTTGRPKGVQTSDPTDRPRHGGRALHVLLPAVRDRALQGQRSHRRVAAVSHGGDDILDDISALRTRDRPDEEVGPGRNSATDRSLQGHEHAHGSDAVPPVARPPT